MPKKSSAAKIAANQANAAKSCGPKSERGKRMSRGNALKSGLFATIVLPGENSQQYQQLRNALIAEKKPVGMEELMLVDQLARAHWWLRRLMRMENGTLKSAVFAEASLAQLRATIARGTKYENEDPPEVYEEDALNALHKHLRQMGFHTTEVAIDKFIHRIEVYSSRLDELREQRKT